MSEIRWGYAMNQWNTVNNTLRREQIERALKVVSVCGFSGVELKAGTGRWEPLGRPELINISFGSASEFQRFLRSCSIDKVVSWYYDPGQYFLEEGSMGRNPANPADHQGIVDSLTPFAEFLQEIGAEFMNVRPMGSFWRETPVTAEKIKHAAACWNIVGKMTAERGIRTVLHLDWLGALHHESDIELMLDQTNPSWVGLTLDTAELTLMGLDPVSFYQQHADRIRLFHLKDVHTTDTLQEYQNKYADNLLKNGGLRKIERWFWEMGRPGGLVNFPGLMREISRQDYHGWIIVESDQSPSPAESAMLNHWYIDNILKKQES